MPETRLPTVHPRRRNCCATPLLPAVPPSLGPGFCGGSGAVRCCARVHRSRCGVSRVSVNAESVASDCPRFTQVFNSHFGHTRPTHPGPARRLQVSRSPVSVAQTHRDGLLRPAPHRVPPRAFQQAPRVREAPRGTATRPLPPAQPGHNGSTSAPHPRSLASSEVTNPRHVESTTDHTGADQR